MPQSPQGLSSLSRILSLSHCRALVCQSPVVPSEQGRLSACMSVMYLMRKIIPASTCRKRARRASAREKQLEAARWEERYEKRAVSAPPAAKSKQIAHIIGLLRKARISKKRMMLMTMMARKTTRGALLATHPL